MLHNLFILKKESGISIGSIDLSDKLYDEQEADLISSSIKAITDFFKTMQFGDIETFQFLDKSIKIIRKKEIILALVSDRDTNLNIYYPKLELISVMIEKSIDWFEWDGNVSKFRALMESAKQVLLD
jgi:hypothetical protein